MSLLSNKTKYAIKALVVLGKNYGKEPMSIMKIAEEENVSVKTIASRLYRGRNMLKEKWREENETL